MSRAEELLNSLDDDAMTTSNTDEGYIVVNEDRTISVPDSLRRLGVQHDHNIETVTFNCPRFWDEHDMSQMKIYINYLRPDGVKGQYLTGNLKVSGDTMTFDWVISNNVTRVKGMLSFLICIVQTDDDGMEVQHWNSELNQECYISEGMECQESIVLGYPDIITHLLIRMEETEAVANEETLRVFTNSWLEQNHDRLLAEIEGKAQDALDSIPPDYTEVYTLAHDSVRTRANAVVCTAAGENVLVSDSSDDYLRGLRIFGKTTQITTNGSQLAQVNIANEGQLYLGVVCSETDDGNILLHGTSTDKMKHRAAVVDLIGGRTYTLSSHKAIALSLGSTTKPSGTESVTFVAPATASYAIYIENQSGTPFDYIRANIMLNIGYTALPWEPYSNAVPSPCPTFPQELRSITDPLICLYGKNLINVDEMELASNKSLTVSSDKYTIIVNGGSDKTYAYSHYDLPEDLVQVLRGRRLRLTSDSVTKSNSSAYSPVQLNIKCADGTFQYPVNHESRLYHEFYLPEDTVEIRFGVYTNNTATLLETDNTVVASGVRLTLAEDHDYEPYRGYQTLTHQGTLRAVPVSQNGNYTDANGQQWICDEIDFERRVYVQRVGLQTFTNAFEYLNVSSVDGSGVFYCGLSGYDVTDYNLSMRSTHFRFAGYDTHNAAAVGRLTDGKFSYIRNPTAGARLYFAVAGITSKVEATEWLANNTPVVYYPLKNPVETSLTADELEAFKWCHTNQPNTTVLNDVGAYMEMKYNADTQTYLENLPKATDAQVQNAVDAWLEANFTTAEGVSF